MTNKKGIIPNDAFLFYEEKPLWMILKTVKYLT